MNIIFIRNENQNDYKEVENLIRRAFWNLYTPGCSEHYLAHIIRTHQDFIHELDLVMEINNEIVASIMYTKSQLVDKKGNIKPIITFGPVAVEPSHQRKGYSKMLIEFSFKKAVELGYQAIVIYGNPDNYVSRGFKSCKKFNIVDKNGRFPAAMMVKELVPGALANTTQWVYYDSPAFNFTQEDMEKFDASFEPMEKKILPSQEEFYIHSNSFLD